jgi:uncharacterized protein (TIGR00255 family)
MNSMTGFGAGGAETDSVSVQVELRAVNNRFCDVNVRLPREISSLEPGVARRIKERFARGRIDATIRREVSGSGNEIHVDRELAGKVQEALLALDPERNQPTSVEFIARFPGVLTVTESQKEADQPGLVHQALEEALGALCAMRHTEGSALKEDLSDQHAQLTDLRARVTAGVEGGVERLQQRLVERLAALVASQLDPARLAQEIAVLADKSDVSEEIVRLGAHLDQLAHLLDETEPVGRRLEFLAQELHREVNTIGSKSQEAEISALVVEMKSVVERIREQAANVE